MRMSQRHHGGDRPQIVYPLQRGALRLGDLGQVGARLLRRPVFVLLEEFSLKEENDGDHHGDGKGVGHVGLNDLHHGDVGDLGQHGVMGAPRAPGRAPGAGEDRRRGHGGMDPGRHHGRNQHHAHGRRAARGARQGHVDEPGHQHGTGDENRPHLDQRVGEHLDEVGVAAGQLHDGSKPHHGRNGLEQAGHDHVPGEGIGPGLRVPGDDGHDQAAGEQGQTHLQLLDDGAEGEHRDRCGDDVHEHRHAPFRPEGRLSGC